MRLFVYLKNGAVEAFTKGKDYDDWGVDSIGNVMVYDSEGDCIAFFNIKYIIKVITVKNID